MLSLTSASLKPKTLFSSPSSKTILKPISAIIIPSSSSKQPPPQQQLYQPFRPPPSPLPSKFRSLDAVGRIDVLANRLGLWFEYAPLISSLYQEGFTPQTIEEATGITGGEQNRLIVGAQVRESLIQSNTDPDVMSFFDTGGAELLYEIRLLSASQRAESVRFIVENTLDMKGAEDLARSIKDFPRRCGDKAWDKFDYNLPGDCLAFMYFRQGQEHKKSSTQRNAALQQALEVAGSESAKSVILSEIDGAEVEEEEKIDDVRVPVVRLKFGEVAEASNVVVLPVCKAEEVLEAPWEFKREGAFGVVVAEKGWQRWVVLPQWEPVAGLAKGGGVVVSFPDARALPWRVNRWYKEEPVLVVADRARQAVEADDGFYLVASSDTGGYLKVRRGSELKVEGVEESLGTVMLVVRPPKEDTDDQLSDEDWD